VVEFVFSAKIYHKTADAR